MNWPRYEDAPRIVIWEMTQACQLACLHCRAEARPERDPRELTTQQGFQLIDQIADLGKPLFILTGGDCMERYDLMDLVAYAVGRGLTTAVSPSATANVTRTRLASLKAAGVHRIALSLDGADAQTHDHSRGVSGSYQRTLEIVQDVRDLKLPLQIGTTITRHNALQLERIAEHVESLGVILWNVFFLVPTGRALNKDMIQAETAERLLHQLYAISRRVRFAIKTTEAPHYRRIKAGYAEGKNHPMASINDAKGFVFISHIGGVYPSGFLPLEVGNVRFQPLGDLYRHSTLFQTLRDPSRLKGKCGRCEYRELCGGSRARAFAVMGDPLAEDPLCVYQPGQPHKRKVA